MKKIPILDILSLVVIVALGVDLYRTHDRLNRLELVTRGGEPLESASLLPMAAGTAAGKHVTIRRGEPRLIFYMSAHCGVCARNMPVWSEVAHQIGSEHALFLVSDPVEMPQMPGYLAKYAVNGVPAVTADPEIVSRYYMFTVPKTVVVDADGKVAKVWRGVVTAADVLHGWEAVAKQ
jgi:thiol-disulfide isomerase/thioredoxin